MHYSAVASSAPRRRRRCDRRAAGFRCAEAVCRYRPRRQQAAPLSSALILGSPYWARNLSFSRAGGEAAALGAALCKTPTSVSQKHATKARNRARVPGDAVDNHRIRLLTICGLADAGLGYSPVNAGDGTKDSRAMPDPSPIATVVARLSSDGPTARKIADALAESFEAEEFATSAFEEAPGRWSLAIHFRQQPDEAAVRALIASAVGRAAADAVAFETLAPTDWVRKSLEGLAPVEAGRFVVHSAHHRARVRTNRIGIEIEAALAFGTGHHGTTRGCLLALDRIVKGRRSERDKSAGSTWPRKRQRSVVLDIGTGTGVLAIAAAKTLRRPVLASDIDARAVTIARDNARINRVGAVVRVIHAAGLHAAPFRARAPYGLIFANILLDPLKALATPMARLVAANRQIVLSGLLAAQAGAAVASYRARGLALVHRTTLEGWATLVLVRPARGRRAKRARVGV